MSEIIVYSKPACPACSSTYRFLDKHGATYTTVDITQNPEALARIKSLGFTQAPVVECGEVMFSGYNQEKLSNILGV